MDNLKIPRRLPEYVLYMFGITLLLYAVIPVIEGRQGLGADEAEHSPLYQGLLILVYAGSACLLVNRWQDALRAIRNNVWLVLIVLLAMLSTLWSMAPELTFRRSVALAGSALLGSCMAIRLQPRQLMVLMMTTATLLALGCIAMVVVRPDLAIHNDQHAGSWRGLFTHKNPMGRTMLLGLVSMGMLLLHDFRIRLVWILPAVLMGFTLIMARSATAALLGTSVALVVGMLWLMHHTRLSRGLIVGVGSTLMLLLGLVFLLEMETIVTAFGRDTTLTGRVYLWMQLFESIRDRPWLGYGFAVFFEHHVMLWAIDGWAPIHSHNGYIQTMVDFGYVGLSLVILLLASLVVRTARCILVDRRHVWIIPLLMTIVIQNMSEAYLISHNSLFWTLLVYLTITTSRIAQPAFKHKADRAMRADPPTPGQPSTLLAG